MKEPAAYTPRPRSLEEMAAVRARLDYRCSRERGLAYRPGPDEVLIATYPKCGTTWTQQIIHALRTRGSMDFDEITEVVPWLEMADALGMDPRAPQVAAPRVFKTHLTWEDIPKGARYVHVTRDPRDVLVSSYHFMEGWYFEPGTVDIDRFAEARFLADSARGGYWSYLLSWWPHRHDPDVLFLAFEDMRADPAATIRRIARFIGCTLDPELEEVVLERSSLSFMKGHERQFDDHLVREMMDRESGLAPGGDSSKVRTGSVGGHAGRLSAATLAALERRWRETIGARCRLASYDALRAALRAGE